MRGAWMALVCLIILGWVQYAWGADGDAVSGIVRPLGVGDVSLPAVLLVIWGGIKTRWDQTIEAHRDMAAAKSALADAVRDLTCAAKEGRGDG